MELLAPAGTTENFLAALEAGADAIYLGGKQFNARANAANFDGEQLRRAIRLAHLVGASVYVTVNIVIGDGETVALAEYLKELASYDADGIIVQDLAVARLAKKVAPTLALHGSTQMTATNLSTVRFLERLGFTRVVLGREASLSEIQYITKDAAAEIEVFIHGALCVCYSGQCLMSSFIGGRSGNRGACAQPCRLPYELLRGDGSVVNAPDEAYVMSPKDLNYSEHMAELMAAGVASFKVEGRMKNAEYVKSVIGSYRHIMDSAGKVTKADKKALEHGFNRGFSTACLDKNVGRPMITAKAPGNRGKRIGPDEGKLAMTLDNLSHFTRKHEIYAYLDGEEGSAPTLTLTTTDGTTVTVTGDYVVQKARKTPTSPEKVREQLDRLGNTVFELADVYVPDMPWMWPSSVLNAMRRDAVEALEEALIRQHQEKRHAEVQRIAEAVGKRHTEFAPLTEPLQIGNDTEKVAANKAAEAIKAGLPILSVQVDELWQVEEAIKAGAEEIVFGGDRLNRRPYDSADYEKVVALCEEQGVLSRLVTPRVIKEDEAKAYSKTLRQLVDAKPDGIGIHWYGAWEQLLALGYEGAVYGESSLQLFNSEALAAVQALGMSGVVASQEATLHQLKTMAKNSTLPLTAIVHGVPELMVSEYCVINSFAGIGHKENCPAPCLQDSYRLRDKTGAEFPIKTDPYCRMHIMNGAVLDMRPYVPELLRARLAGWRIDGRSQDKRWLKQVISDYKGLRAGQLPVPPKSSDGTVTRGHYFKGIF